MGLIIKKENSRDVINKLLELTDDFDSTVRDSAVRSIIRLKGIIPKDMKEEVEEMLKFRHPKESD